MTIQVSGNSQVGATGATTISQADSELTAAEQQAQQFGPNGPQLAAQIDAIKQGIDKGQLPPSAADGISMQIGNLTNKVNSGQTSAQDAGTQALDAGSPLGQLIQQLMQKLQQQQAAASGQPAPQSATAPVGGTGSPSSNQFGNTSTAPQNPPANVHPHHGGHRAHAAAGVKSADGTQMPDEQTLQKMMNGSPPQSLNQIANQIDPSGDLAKQVGAAIKTDAASRGKTLTDDQINNIMNMTPPAQPPGSTAPTVTAASLTPAITP